MDSLQKEPIESPEANEVLKMIKDLFSDKEEKQRFLNYIKLKKIEEYDSMNEILEKLFSTDF